MLATILRYGSYALKAVPTIISLVKAVKTAVQTVEKEHEPTKKTAKDIIEKGTLALKKRDLAIRLVLEYVPRPKWISEWFWTNLVGFAVDNCVEYYNRRFSHKWGKSPSELLDDAL